MGYDISKIKSRVNKMTKSSERKSDADEVKLNYWKPEMGDNVIRFLPYSFADGQPFQELAFYNSPVLNERRLVAPFQFGLADPIHDLMVELRKEHQGDKVWNQMKELRVKESFYAPILVRGKEDEGVKIWEMSQRVVQGVYEVLMSDDWADEQLFDVHEGFDFTITARDSGRTFKGYTIKEITPLPKRKASPALKTKAACDELVASVPNIGEVMQKYCMSEEKLTTLLNNFLNPDDVDGEASEEGTTVTAEVIASEEGKAATSKMDAAFSDLDD
jgi:hypothetical protein